MRIGLFILYQHLSFFVCVCVCFTADYRPPACFFPFYSRTFLLFKQEQLLLIIVGNLYVRINKPNGLFLIFNADSILSLSVLSTFLSLSHPFINTGR